MQKFTREQIRARFDARLAAKEPILLCETGAGITAKLTEMYGIDMILVTAASEFRLRAIDDVVSVKPYGDVNNMVLRMVTDMRAVVHNTPVIAEVAATDPYVLIEEYMARLDMAGVSGVANSPAQALAQLSNRDNMNRFGYGTDAELEFLKEQIKAGLFTIGNAYYKEDALEFAKAGVDLIILNLRYVVEAATEPELYGDVAKCCAYVQGMYEEVKALAPNSYVVAHGGPFTQFENIKALVEQTDVDGFMGSKYLDEDVMRSSILENQRGFAGLTLR